LNVSEEAARRSTRTTPSAEVTRRRPQLQPAVIGGKTRVLPNGNS